MHDAALLFSFFSHFPHFCQDLQSFAFNNKDRAARGEVLNLAKARVDKLSSAVDYIAGVIGLRFHRRLVARPITEQHCAYRDNRRENLTSSSDGEGLETG
ncbi:MAG: hypothetical protein LC776_11880 [Acidobacteria bacterium]|nr:hypothetical protein [Acidobacteriota bacterium]